MNTPVCRPHSPGAALRPLKRHLPLFTVLFTLSPAYLAAQDSAASAPSTSGDQVVTLSPFAVTGDSRGYQALSSTSATMVDMKLQNIPMGVSVVTSDFMKDLQAYRLEDALRYVPAVSEDGQAANHFTIRGVDPASGIMHNGLENGFSDISGFSDADMIDRIEVIRGPAGLMYGAGVEGGVINIIYKRPENFNDSSVKFMAGSWGRYRESLDTNWVITENKANDSGVYFRLAAGYEISNAYQAFFHEERSFINPSLTWQLSRSTSVTLTFISDHLEGLAGNFNWPLYTGPAGTPVQQYHIIPLNTFPNEAGAVPHDYSPVGNANNTISNYKGIAAFLDIKSQITPDFATHLITNYYSDNKPQLQRWGFSSTDGLNDGIFGIARPIEDDDGWVSQFDATYQHAFTNFKVLMVGGANVRLFHSEVDLYENFTLPTLPLYYGPDQTFPISPAPGPGWALQTGSNAAQIKQQNEALYYVGNLSTLDDRWSLFFGVRNAFAGHNSTTEYFDPVTAKQVATNVGGTRRQIYNTTDNHVLPQLGAMGTIIPGLKAYVMYCESYSPNAAPLPDETTDSIEGGFKIDLLNGVISGQVDYFSSVEKHVQVTDNTLATGSNPTVATGKTDVAGAEVELYFTPSPQWQTIVAYSNLQAVIKSFATDPDMVGRPPQSTPRNTGSIFTKYYIDTSLVQKLYVGGGWVARSWSLAFPSSSADRWVKDPGYDRFDLIAGFSKKILGRNCEFAFTLNNVFDKLYFKSQSYLGDPRNFLASATLHF